MAQLQDIRTLSAPAQTARRRRSARFRKRWLPWLFIAPYLALHLIVVAGPSLSAVYYSMTDWSGIGAAKFVGLQNFQDLFFADDTFWAALSHNLLWMIFFMTIPFLMALVAASLLSLIRRAGMAYRTLLFIPYIVPSVITASIWRNLLSPTRGIGAQLANWGMPGLDIAFLGKSKTVLWAIAFVDNWHFWGFLMVLFLAAMQGISPSLYDAAKIDGANRWQEFLHVTIPGIRPTVVFMLLMVAIWSFLSFDYIWILTQGGPAGSSEVLATFLYKQAFNRFEAGYAAAIGLTISLIAGLIIGAFVILRRRGWEI